MRLKYVYSQGGEFYDQDYGEHRSFAPIKLKTMKEVEAIQRKVQLTDIKPGYSKPFDMPKAGYELPARYILNYQLEDNKHR